MRTPTLLLAGFLVLVAAQYVQAQSEPTAKAAAPKAALLKDGVYRKNGLIMRLQAGQASRLSAPLTLENGAVVRPTGIIVGPKGSRELLPENHAITMQGTIVLLRDDMFTPSTIDRSSLAATGSTGETQLTVPSSAATASGSGLSPRLTAKLLRTEQRLAMLEEMASYLEDRTQVKVAATMSLDQQLRQVNTQLRRATPAPSVKVDTTATKLPH